MLDEFTRNRYNKTRYNDFEPILTTNRKEEQHVLQ